MCRCVCMHGCEFICVCVHVYMHTWKQEDSLTCASGAIYLGFFGFCLFVFCYCFCLFRQSLSESLSCTRGQILFLKSCLPVLLDRISYWDLQLTSQAGLAGQQSPNNAPIFWHVCWGLNSGPHTYKASTLLTEPSPSPLNSEFYRSLP